MNGQANIRLARRLRKASNTPEKMAWETLRSLRKQGFAVRRQHPIGPYVVDFAIMKARLVIEVDGSIHRRDDIRDKDELREQRISQMGWRVLRIDAQTALSPDHLMGLVSNELGI
ncbi:MAG: endonuclease domain-containing protein [Parvularculaceae bacterium]